MPALRPAGRLRPAGQADPHQPRVRLPRPVGTGHRHRRRAGPGRGSRLGSGGGSPGGRNRTRQRRSLVQAELIAFRVAHDVRDGPTVAMRLDQLRAESYQAFDLGHLLVGIDMDVEVYPVLDDLALGYWLITSTDRRSLVAGLAQLAERLGVAGNEQEAAARAALAALADRDGWLLVYDNARDPADLAGLLPARGRGRVLITSRNPNWDRYATPFAVEPFSTADAATYLTEHTPGGGTQDRAAAEAIAAQVHGLPLALDVAAAYCRRTGTTLAEYARLTRAQQARAVEGRASANLLLSYRDLGWNVAAVQLLRLLAYLAPTGVPRDLAPAAPAALCRTCADPLRRNEMYAALLATSLVRPGEPGQVRVHELVQEAVREDVQHTTRTRLRRLVRRAKSLLRWTRLVRHDPTASWPEARWVRTATELLVAEFPTTGHTVGRWDRLAVLLPHAYAVLERADAAPRRAADLRFALGYYLNDRGEVAAARELLWAAHESRQRGLGPEHPDTLAAANSLAVTLGRLGDHPAARDLHQRTLAARRRLLG